LFALNLPTVWCRTCGFSNYQLGFDGVLVAKFGAWAVDSLQEISAAARPIRARAGARWLSGILEGGALDVVKSDYGNIFGNVQARLAQGANRAMAEISLKEKRAVKSCPRSQQHFGGHVSELRRRRIALQLRYDAGLIVKPKMLSNALDVGPSHLGHRQIAFIKGQEFSSDTRCDGPTSSALLSILV